MQSTSRLTIWNDETRKAYEMTQIRDANHMKNTAHNTEDVRVFSSNREALSHVTGLIQLSVGVLNGLIGLRFLLKLMAVDPTNPLANMVYFITSPFLWTFRGLTQTPSPGGIEVEFFSLIAILVYAMAGWILVQLAWILFARTR